MGSMVVLRLPEWQALHSVLEAQKEWSLWASGGNSSNAVEWAAF